MPTLNSDVTVNSYNHFYLFQRNICTEITVFGNLSNVALLTFEGAAINVTFLAFNSILLYLLTMVLKQKKYINIY